MGSYSSGRYPSVVTFTIDIPICNASVAQVSFTSLYVYFISEFTEVINSLLSLSCDSLAMLCKHI